MKQTQARINEVYVLLAERGNQLDFNGNCMNQLEPFIEKYIKGDIDYWELTYGLNRTNRMNFANIIYFINGNSTMDMLKYKLFNIKPNKLEKENNLELFDLAHAYKRYERGDKIYVYHKNGDRLAILNSPYEVCTAFKLHPTEVTGSSTSDNIINDRIILRFLNKINMANIFDLVEELRGIYHQLEESGGEEDPVLEARLSITEEDIDNKLDAYAMYIKSITAENILIKEEAQIFLNKIKTNEAKIVRMKETMAGAIRIFCKQKPNGCHGHKTTTRSYWTQDTISVGLDDDFDVGEFQKYALTFDNLSYKQRVRMEAELNKTMGDVIMNNTSELIKVSKKDIKLRLNTPDLEHTMEEDETEIPMCEVEGAMLIKTNTIRFR